MVDPVVTAEIAMATNATGPGSPVAQALIAVAHQPSLNDFFDSQLLGVTRRR